MSQYHQKNDLDVFKQERLNQNNVGFFSNLLEQKAKQENLASLKLFLQALLKKENFLADYVQFVKTTQTTEYLSDFMRNYVDLLTTRLEDKDAFLLAECFFYAFLFLADKCRLAEHIFISVLADFVESFGFGLADNLLEVCIRKGFRKLEERLRFIYLYYSDDEQLSKLLVQKDSWSSFTLLYMFLMNGNCPRARYLKFELLRTMMQNEEANNPAKLAGKGLTPELLLYGLLKEEQTQGTLGSKRNRAPPEQQSILERSLKELLRRPGSKDFIEGLFGVYQGLSEYKKCNPGKIEFEFIRDTLLELSALIQSNRDRTTLSAIQELKVILALFCNFLTDFAQQTLQETALIDMVYDNLLDLINTENSFTKYIGVSVFTNLLLKHIKKKVNDNGNKNHPLHLIKVCLKGLDSEPEKGLFMFKPINIWPQITAAVNRLIEESMGDEKRRITRIQEYLRRVEEEFSANKNGNNEMNNEVWKFLKKLP